MLPKPFRHFFLIKLLYEGFMVSQDTEILLQTPNLTLTSSTATENRKAHLIQKKMAEPKIFKVAPGELL